MCFEHRDMNPKDSSVCFCLIRQTTTPWPTHTVFKKIIYLNQYATVVQCPVVVVLVKEQLKRGYSDKDYVYLPW